MSPLGKDKEETLRRQLECPICFTLMPPPIRQCPNGHTLCDACSQECDSCPQCRSKPINIRALALEQAASDLVCGCPHASKGCTVKLKYKDLRAHAATCAVHVAETPCPVKGCNATMRTNNRLIVEHLKKVHKLELFTASAAGSFTQEFTSGEDWRESSTGTWGPYLLEAHNTTFMWMVAESGKQCYQACITGLGEEKGEFWQTIECYGRGRRTRFKGPIGAPPTRACTRYAHTPLPPLTPRLRSPQYSRRSGSRASTARPTCRRATTRGW